MSYIERLVEQFSKFPGIGPRQAKRHVYFLLAQKPAFRKDFTRAIENLDTQVFQCERCRRFFSTEREQKKYCSICSDESRVQDTFLVVERQADFENIEKMGAYKGQYFILGGSLPLLEKNPTERIRARELFDHVQANAKEDNVREVILAMNATPEGENTSHYIQKILEVVAKKYGFKISTLGRGLSTGTELEYSDGDTFRSALESRK